MGGNRPFTLQDIIAALNNQSAAQAQTVVTIDTFVPVPEGLTVAEAVSQAVDTTPTFDWNDNLVTNTSFETDLSGWSGVNSATLTRTVGGSQGNWSATATSTQSSTPSGIITSSFITGLAAGNTYVFTADCFCWQQTNFTLSVDWYNTAGTLLSTTVGSAFVLPLGWDNLSTVHVAPATATKAKIYVTGGVMAIGQAIGVDSIQFVFQAATWGNASWS